VGLAQRAIEAAGLSTISLSNIPVLTSVVGAPRVAGIEYPFGRTLGQPGDAAGQTAVLRETLWALEQMDHPGCVWDLPFEWPESPRLARAHPPQPPPIVAHLRRCPWDLPRLMRREPPASAATGTPDDFELAADTRGGHTARR
jgi:glycine reductase complex component B subunit gamma